MKAVVLAAGRGRRLGPLGERRNKCLTPVGERTVLDHVLDAAAFDAVSEIIVVVGFRADEVMARCGQAHRGTPLRYVHQAQPRGPVDAIGAAQEAIAGDDFILLLGDELMAAPRHAQLVRQLDERSLFALCGVLEVGDPSLVRRNYSVDLDAAGRVVRLEEKPEAPTSNLLGTGVCVFRNAIFSYIATTPVHPVRGEKELPALIQAAVDAGHPVGAAPVCARYVNLNTEDDLGEIRSWLDVE